MMKILFYILSLCLWEIEAAWLNMDVDQVIARGDIPDDDTIGIYEQWLKDYERSDAVPYLENLIWPYYHINKDKESELKHLRAFLKCCKDEIDLFPMSHESRDKLLNLPDNVLIKFNTMLKIPEKSDAIFVNKVHSQLLEKLLGDDELLKELVNSMDGW